MSRAGERHYLNDALREVSDCICTNRHIHDYALMVS